MTCGAAGIRRLRRQLGLSQRAFAARVGCSPSAIWTVEAGQRDLPLSLLNRISRVFDISVWELLAPDPPTPVSITAAVNRRLAKSAKKGGK